MNMQQSDMISQYHATGNNLFGFPPNM
jgi:hypothetical protein